MVQETVKKPDKDDLLLRFLQRTKEGEYAEISYIPNTVIRVYESTEVDFEEENYTYSYD